MRDPGSAGSGSEGPSLRIVGGRVLTPDGWVPGSLTVEGARVGPIDAGTPDHHAVAHRTIDASGLLVVPGFVDIQVNGGFGHDFTSRPESIWETGARLPLTGVTSFLPTLVSAPAGAYRRAIDALASGPPAWYAGARPLGLHFEGPMLNPARRGAHSEHLLRRPSAEVIEGWDAGSGVRLVTLAPELPGAVAIVEELIARGVTVSAGHSDATFEEANAAFDRGISMGTHLFNAMSGILPRAPGLAGAILARPGVAAGLIADGVHVHRGAVATAWRAMGPEGLALVTDAIAAAGSRSTGSRIGALAVAVDGGAPRGPDGRLAGSVLTMDAAVRRLAIEAPCDPADAIRAAASIPAGILGERSVGALRPGASADVVLLTPALHVKLTMVAGIVVWNDGVPSAGGDTRSGAGR